MSKPEIKGLKSFVQETVLRDLKVTPEMRARLERRIRREEAGRRTRPAWWVPAGATVVAAALLLVVGGSMWEQRPPAPAEYEPLSVQAPPPVQTPVRARPGQLFDLDSGAVKVTVTDQAGRDEFGKAVFTRAVIDADGNAIMVSPYSAAPPSPGIPGVEARPGQKIVLNADYSLEVKAAHETMAALQAMTTASGGYVVEATLNQGEDDSWAGRLVLRIPADQFSGATARMAGFGKVKHQRQWTQDVTDQYVDLQSRLKVLKEHEQKLQELALKAANFDDWLRLARQINETRTQVENLQGSLNQLANRVEYSTLNIALVQPAPGRESVAKSDGLGRQMSAAFAGSIRSLGDLGGAFLVRLAGATPLLVPVGIAGGLLLLWLRRRRLATR